MDTLTLPISPEEKALLHRLAETNHSSDEEVATAALREYLRFEAEQIRKIKAGVEAADARPLDALGSAASCRNS